VKHYSILFQDYNRTEKKNEKNDSAKRNTWIKYD